MIDENYIPSSNFEMYMKNAILKKGVEGLPNPQSRMEVLLWELCTLLDGDSGGQAGSNGKSAYELAVQQGYVGTLDEWLASLVGPQGSQGPQGAKGNAGNNGKSAYEIAVAEGFQGTQDEWLASLIGPQGPKGNTGNTGKTGDQGPKGADGVTPVRGTDYWTAEDIQAIHDYIDSKINEAKS